jgi:hypothetical protein
MEDGYAGGRTVSIMQKRAIQIIAPTISQIDHFAMQKKGLVLNV